MKGINTLCLNKETVIEAIQFYCDRTMVNFPSIIDITIDVTDEDMSIGSFILTLEERESETKE